MMAITLAAKENNYKAVESLLLAKANINIKDGRKFTACLWAAELGNKETVKVLVDFKADLEIPDRDEKEPLIYATDFDTDLFISVAKLLIDGNAYLEAGDDENNTSLIRATTNGYYNMVKMLIDSGAELNNKNRTRETALMKAAQLNYMDHVKLLVTSKADLDCEDLQFRTAIIYAVKARNLEIVQYLCNSGCNMAARDEKGRTTRKILNIPVHKLDRDIVTWFLANKDKRGKKIAALRKLGAGRKNRHALRFAMKQEEREKNEKETEEKERKVEEKARAEHAEEGAKRKRKERRRRKLLSGIRK